MATAPTQRMCRYITLSPPPLLASHSSPVGGQRCGLSDLPRPIAFFSALCVLGFPPPLPTTASPSLSKPPTKSWALFAVAASRASSRAQRPPSLLKNPSDSAAARFGSCPEGPLAPPSRCVGCPILSVYSPLDCVFVSVVRCGVWSPRRRSWRRLPRFRISARVPC